jgi:hypothetical protein
MPFNVEREGALSQAPHAHFGALNAMLDLWKSTSLEQGQQKDGGIDDEDACEAHGGLGDNEGPQSNEALVSERAAHAVVCNLDLTLQEQLDRIVALRFNGSLSTEAFERARFQIQAVAAGRPVPLAPPCQHLQAI